MNNAPTPPRALNGWLAERTSARLMRPELRRDSLISLLTAYEQVDAPCSLMLAAHLGDDGANQGTLRNAVIQHAGTKLTLDVRSGRLLTVTLH